MINTIFVIYCTGQTDVAFKLQLKRRLMLKHISFKREVLYFVFCFPAKDKIKLDHVPFIQLEQSINV